MKLTAKGRYAVTAMLDLSMHQTADAAVPLADIANRQSLSQAFLEQLFSKLKRQQLVQSIRGAKGGYRLNLPAEVIKVADIVEAISEDTDSTHCKGAKNCKNGGACMTHDLWENLSELTNDYLRSISLKDLTLHHFPVVTIEKQGKTHDS